jgi:CheY-like chemotaxis protein
VLIVEDEAAFADVVGELLTDEGYAVVRARDGVTAVNMLTADCLSPDLIVCDVMLPGLRGDRLAAEVRRRFPTRRLPILLLSASADPRVRLRDVWFMAKPLDLKDFLMTVKRLVEPRRRGAFAAV